ncbi:hypothetical protein Acsp06_16530 [Actinomycetospora sp. NBRC 106375]|uniref:hypothetical protein n=1 Tax=Actinomycetospora sp. NBRC 106375 TaxID=3032207 RepID=UPI0024A30A2F|nr:hypothetical protein [Actinomycetospora sp. NBRC 106375]GLZ45468.1 hypothetical protein Acsp06_16530 [Actinomycetospora sp. NBRC 106375]
MTIAHERPVTSPRPVAAPDEHAARAQLRAQIARLEHRLAAAGPSSGGPAPVPGPRVLDLGELERVRDDLVERVGVVERAAADRTRAIAAAHARLAGMLADPAAHRGAVVTSADLGEPGCVRWAVRPVLGPVGRLAGWWRVRMSSGCP